MQASSSITILALLSTSTLAAQIPAPAPTPRVVPRAEWIVTAGVSGSIPANRHWSPAVEAGDKMYVFGGRTGTTGSGSKRNDLHEFDATTLTWTTMNVDGAPGAPTQRYRNVAAWDQSGGKLVMFGGEDSAGGLLGDTWEWDPNTNVWTETTPAAPNPGTNTPSARRFAAMAYDPVTTGLILFGGTDASGSALDDTWLYIAGSWAPLVPATIPPARANHSMVTRADFGDVFLCAGNDLITGGGRTHHLDTWRWNGGDWVQIVPTTAAVPHGHAGNQAVYDSLRQRVVLQGGQGISTNSANTGGAYGTAYGGSPSGWTSEFDCVSNEWKLYGDASALTADPVIGRASRYYPAFLAGKVYLWGGQNPAGVGASLTEVKEYQANPIAAATSFGAGCNSMTMTASTAPWAGRTFELSVNGLQAGSLVGGFFGFVPHAAPIPLTPVPFPGCATLLIQEVATFPLTNVGGVATFALPISDDPGVLGLSPYFHAVQVEAGFNLSSSNALQLTLGAL